MTSVDDLISQGQFQEGLDLVWGEIDSGDTYSRIELANLFTANGLHAFAQSQWEFLAENFPELDEFAKIGIGANKLWLRDYDAASDVIRGVEDSEELRQAIDSAMSNDPLITVSSLSEVAGEVLLDEANLMLELEHSFSAESQARLIQARDIMANIAATISFPKNAHLRNVQVEMTSSNNLSVLRALGERFRSPKEALILTAHACGLLIHSLGQDQFQIESDLFHHACATGLSSFEKISLLTGKIFTPENRIETEAFQAVTWGLNQIGLLSGFIYGGLLND